MKDQASNGSPLIEFSLAGEHRAAGIQQCQAAFESGTDALGGEVEDDGLAGLGAERDFIGVPGGIERAPIRHRQRKHGAGGIGLGFKNMREEAHLQFHLDAFAAGVGHGKIIRARRQIGGGLDSNPGVGSIGAGFQSRGKFGIVEKYIGQVYRGYCRDINS